MVKSADQLFIEISHYSILWYDFSLHMIRKPLDIKNKRSTFKIKAARLYSDVFSPPSAFAIFGFIIAWSKMPFWQGSLHAVIFGTLSSLLPLGYIIVLLKKGVINDIHLSNAKDRKIPYLLGVLGAVIALILLRIMGTSGIFQNYILTNIIGLALLGIINSRWLISAHTSTITAITTFSGFAFSFPVALALSPLVLLTIFIRYYLKRHTLKELVSGVLVGSGSVLVLALLGMFDGLKIG